MFSPFDTILDIVTIITEKRQIDGDIYLKHNYAVWTTTDYETVDMTINTTCTFVSFMPILHNRNILRRIL